MLVDLLDKLIDRCIQLFQHEKVLRRELLDDFVDPVRKELESVHSAYLSSFESYRDTIQNAETLGKSLRLLTDKIKKDSLFSAGDRAKLQTFADAEPPPMAYEFFVAIRVYLSELITFQSGDHAVLGVSPNLVMSRNAYRRQLVEELRIVSRRKSLTQEDKKLLAINKLDWIVAEMQDRFADVLTEYVSLKNSLIH